MIKNDSSTIRFDSREITNIIERDICTPNSLLISKLQ